VLGVGLTHGKVGREHGGGDLAAIDAVADKAANVARGLGGLMLVLA
jgi:hypothetical protein